MSRHTVELAGRIVAIVALLLILANATLVDRVPPTVQHISLGRTAGDDHVGLTHTTVDVQFSKEVDRASAQAHFRIEPAVAGSYSWDGARTMIFTPAEKLPVSTQFTVSVSPGYRDTSGNVADQGGTTWTFHTIGLPTLASSTPNAGATAVPIDSAITLTFDRLMDVAATQAAISVVPATRFRATWSGSTVKLTPLAPLAFSTNYQVTVSDSAADTDGNSPDAPFQVDFTTVTAGLGVTRVLPSDGSAGAPIDGSIVMFFDGPVDPASVSGLVRVTPPAPGEVRVESLPTDRIGDTPPASVVVYQPASALAPHTTYTVELLDGAKRSDDPKKVAAGRSWTFTTGAPSDSLQNQIVFLSSRTGVRNLWAMNPDGSNARQLTDELSPVTAYDVSGDGKRLVYATAGLVKTFKLGESSPTVLTPDDAWDYAPRLLPDGSAVIVGRRGRLAGQDRGIWELPIESASQPRQLLPGGAPPIGSVTAGSDAGTANGAPGAWTSVAAVSSDGTSALVQGTRGEVVSVDLTPATATATSTGLHDPLGPIQWSDHDHGFVLEATLDGASAPAAWLLAPGKAPAQLGAGGAWLTVSSRAELAWLSGSPILHVTIGHEGGGTAGRQVTAAVDAQDREPGFSPSGDLVVFARITASTGSTLGIWTVRTDGLELTQLSPDGEQPRWLP